MCFTSFDFSVDSALVMEREIQADSGTVTDTETSSETPTTTVTTTTKKIKYCRSLNCGWAKYTPFTRIIEYYYKNTCECRDHQYCIRVGENPQASAYDYKCRDRPPTTSTLLPPTTPEFD